MKWRSGVVLGFSSLLAAYASASEWHAAYPADEGTQSTKNCGAITDTYGCLWGWIHWQNDPSDQLSKAKIGAEWDGSQYTMSTEPTNSPPKSNWVEHQWDRTSLGGGAKQLLVWSTTSPSASGQAAWLMLFEEWWFSPVCNVNQLEPTVSASVDGGSYKQIGFSEYNSEHSQLGSTQAVLGGGGTGVQYAGAAGDSGDWEARVDLSDSSSGSAHVKVKFDNLTTTSATCDNAKVTKWNVHMFIEAGTGVIDAE